LRHDHHDRHVVVISGAEFARPLPASWRTERLRTAGRRGGHPGRHDDASSLRSGAAAADGALPASRRPFAGSRTPACLDLRNAAISASLARLAREVGERGFASEVIVEGLGMFIAGELARHLDEVATRTPRRCGGLAPWQLKRIDEHLNAGNWGCSISELAGQCGISAGHVMRAFRQSTGRTLAGHIAEARIERARDLLSGDELSIGEISRDLQFAHPSSFAAAFRRSTGMTPRQYRQSGL
jgi:AraC family transcriptional regulator